MKRLIAAGVVVLFACGAQGQSSGKRMEFEVASLKFASGQGRSSFRGGPGTGDPTRLVVNNLPLFSLIMRAYDLGAFQISGLHDDGERYDINAKVPAGATKEEVRLMLQNLLADRFHLKVHLETKELPIYEMTVSKTGLKIKEHEGESPKEEMDLPAGRGIPRDKNGNLAPPPNSWIMLLAPGGGAQGRFNAIDEPIAAFVKDLTRQFGRFVVDSTGLTGRYDFNLTYSTDVPAGAGSKVAAAGAAAPPAAAPSDPEQDYGPNLLGAVQALGFKLESKKGPVELLVVDHFEKVPAEN
jgi:uncharacterized protein (TIGR03435 family)